jgi:mono/diheme cytochrome c family protein
MGGTLLVASCMRVGSVPEGGEKAAMTDEEKIALGKKLTTFGGCNDCHTPGGLYGAPDMERELAGSDMGWGGPWGTAYASNLTPDLETGIGAMSEDEIVATMRTGQRPDKSPLLPPMPWPNFAALSDEEMHAIAFYLKSLPPVKHARPSNLRPDQVAGGPVATIPPPGAWDAPKGPPEGAPPGAH